jgi:hypothetical protein
MFRLKDSIQADNIGGGLLFNRTFRLKDSIQADNTGGGLL